MNLGHYLGFKTAYGNRAVYHLKNECDIGDFCSIGRCHPSMIVYHVSNGFHLLAAREIQTDPEWTLAEPAPFRTRAQILTRHIDQNILRRLVPYIIIAGILGLNGAGSRQLAHSLPTGQGSVQIYSNSAELRWDDVAL